MGNKWNSGLQNANQFDLLDEDLSSTEIEYLESPSYTLEDAKNLTELTQKQITWLLLQFKPRGEPMQEEVDGYAIVYKLNRYGLKETRWLLITTKALYIVEPMDFTLCSMRITIDNIKSLGFSLDNKCFGIKTKEEFYNCHLFYTKTSIFTVNAIKTMHYLEKNDFINIILAESATNLLDQIHENEEIEEPDLQAFETIKAAFGTKGEYLITSLSIFQRQPKISRGKIFLSNFCLYLTTLDIQISGILKLDTIKRLVLCENHLDFVVRSTREDFWLIHSQSYAILKEIEEVIYSEHNKKQRILFLDSKEIHYRGFLSPNQ
jgi:hypothetical protein